jgi:tetratricopeptide (TPR) repeat protein
MRKRTPRSKQQRIAQPSAATDSLDRTQVFEWIGLALIVLVTVVVYLPALNGGVLWDDSAHLTRPELQTWTGLARIWTDPHATQQYYPLLHSAFWLEHKLWGDAVLGYHLVNVFWHLLSVLLVYAVLKKLEIPGALLAAALFALHPVMVESVAWIAEQKNTLSAVFYLSAMLMYLEFDQSRRRSQYCVALGLFVLGLLTKTVTASLPAALLVIFWWQRGMLSWKRDVLPLVPFFLLGAIAGLITAWIERTLIGAAGAEFEMTLVERGLLAGRVIWFYVMKLLWPANLMFVYPRWQIEPTVWWQWLFPVAALGATVAFWSFGRKSRAPLAAWLLFVGTLFPALGFLNVYPFIFSFVADHFQYLASLGLFALVSAAISRGLARLHGPVRVASVLLCMALLGTLAVLSWRQSRMYADSFALYRTTIERNPDCWMAHFQLGARLDANGDRKEAIEHYQQALRIRPNYAEADNNLGLALMQLGRNTEAIEHFQHAVKVSPDFDEPYNNLGLALSNAGRQNEAIEAYKIALERRPEDSVALNNLGIALAVAGRPSEAIEPLERAVRQKPDYAEAHNSLGIALARCGETQRAVEHFLQAVKLNPSYANAHKNLGGVLAGAGDLAGGTTHLEEALRLQPDLADAHYMLGGMKRQAGQSQAAIEHYQTAMRLKPDFFQAYIDLAGVFNSQGHPEDAVATAEKGIEVARRTGHQAQAEQIEGWLKHYRTELQRSESATSSKTD